MVADQGGAELAPFDHDIAGPEVKDGAHGARDVGVAAEEPRFLVVEDHTVAASKHLRDLLAFALDPQVHRIDDDEARVNDLVENPKLDARIGVPEKYEGLGYGVLGHPGVEGLEHIEIDERGFAHVHVLGIAPAPAKGKAIGGLETAEINVALGQQFAVRRRKIAANHAGHGGWGEEARGQRGIGG